ncbi:MAG: hypothetical protein AAFQ74_09960 [Cyanobacteria bacterium J06623_4]
MTTDFSPAPTFLQRLGSFLTGPASEADRQTARFQQVQLHAVEVIAPLTAPDSFYDYAADGDEPADLALTSLIPSELALLNLPHARPEAMPIQTTDPSLSSSDVLAADLADLTPAGLISLNLQKKARPTLEGKQPLPDLSSLPRENRQTASRVTAKASMLPMPAQYFEDVNALLADMLDQQLRQTRHNEQLGALVKQLLGQIALQQRQLNALGHDSYSDIQQIVSSCLSGKPWSHRYDD